jgi:predicted solute-binding protein
MKELIRKVLKEETELPLFIRRRVSMEELDDLVDDVKSSIDVGYDKTASIYDTITQFIASKKTFKFNNETEQGYWDSYIEVEEPLVNYVKSKLD